MYPLTASVRYRARSAEKFGGWQPLGSSALHTSSPTFNVGLGCGFELIRRPKGNMTLVSRNILSIVSAFATLSIAQNAFAQDSQSINASNNALIPASSSTTGTPSCELHVFPTKIINADGRSAVADAIVSTPMGLLVSTAAAVAASAIDTARHQKTMMAVDEQIRSDLSPENQISVLKNIDLISVLKLDKSTQIIWEDAPITQSDVQSNPSLDTDFKRTQSEIKNRIRISSSMTPCYNELIVKEIGFHRSGMRSQLNSFFEIRRFWGKQKTGDYIDDTLFGVSPKNFPAMQPDQAAAAVEGLQAAFAKDFTDWAARKVK